MRLCTGYLEHGSSGPTGRQGQSDGCNEIITLIKFVLSTERAGRDDKSKARQAAPPLDAML